MSDERKNPYAAMAEPIPEGRPVFWHTLVPMTADRAKRALLAKIGALELAGHTVALTGDIPGLFRIDNGPEITTNQLLGWPL